jgi:hypothetical protein
MMKRIYAALVAAALIALAPSFPAAHEGRGHKHQCAACRVHRRALKARKRTGRRAVSYVCPMHPDMRSNSPGECPKCGMNLMAERKAAKAAPGQQGESPEASEARPQ